MLANIIKFIVEKVLVPLVVLITVALLLATPFMVYSVYEGSKKDKIYLVASNWECTKTQSIITPVLVGNVHTIRTIYRCIQYTKRGE